MTSVDILIAEKAAPKLIELVTDVARNHLKWESVTDGQIDTFCKLLIGCNSQGEIYPGLNYEMFVYTWLQDCQKQNKVDLLRANIFQKVYKYGWS